MTETAQLSDRKHAQMEKSVSDKFEITRRTPDEAMPLSYEQEQVWLHAQLATNLPLYNEPGTIRYLGALDVSALEKSFNEILRRHEAWRTCFEMVDGVPVQKVQPSLRVSLPVLDLRALPAERRESEALRIATEDARKPIDLTKAPLFRTRLMRLGNEEYRLYLTLSHIIFDGFAIYRVFLPELSTLYESFAAGRHSPLPELSIQYADYACWQRRNITQETLAKDLDYWKRELAGSLPESYLPADRQRVGPQTFCGSAYPFQLSSQLSSALVTLSRSQGVTLFQILLAGFAALLSRYSGEPIIPIGSLTAGRKLHETQSLLGYFVNTVVLRLDLSGDPNFRDLVKRVRNVALGALEHDNLPFEHLVREMRTTRDSSHNPLFQALFSLAPPLPKLDPAWQMTVADVDTGVSKYDLHFEIDQRGDEILPRFHYSTDLFDPATIARMANHWMNLLEGAAGNPDLRVSQLPLLSKREKDELIVEWNDTEADYPRDKSIPQQFAAQCERTPDIVAVREGDQRLTFCQLDKRSNSLAQYLRDLGAGPGTTVALCIERSIDMVAGLLGILKTGAAYVPLDPSYPPERLGFMLKDSGAAIVIAKRESAGKIPANSARAVWLDSNWSAILGEPTDSPTPVQPTSNQPDDAAYVLYTSGSTGMPKGVQGTHRAYLNRFAWMWRAYPFQAGEICCQKTNLGFVDSVWEIFGPLLAGVPNVIIPQEIMGDPEELLTTLARERVTRIVLVPSLLRMLLDHAPQLGKRVPQLKLWTCSGEVLPTDLAERFRAGYPAATLLNLYGSAEVAADVTCHEVSDEDLLASSIPIGRPIANTQVYILDGNRNPVPIGVRGEIYVGGDNLARGYWQSPELTAERFVENPITPERSPRLFRTGDLGRFKSTGEIEYLGRVDSQVKLRGMRLELGEVEVALSGHPGVREAMVALTPDQQQLAAYITVEKGQEPSAEELRRYLRARLPEYMVPASYSRLQQWPLLPSGKVDRRALLQLGHAESAQQSAFVAPHDAVEDQLLTIWKGILNLDAISVTDNFFSIGGYSLASARLLARIQQTFGRKLGLRDVFEAPTIAEMAELIRREGKSSDMQGILPLQPNGSLPPFFWVRGGPLFLPLSRRLGPERPSFGLQLSSSLVSKLPATYKFEDIASSLIEVMRAVRPNGPYYLGGLCVNGVVAYEMARQLVAAGESVPLLVMLDSQNPTYYFDYSPDGRTSFLYQKLKFHLRKLAKLRRIGLRHYIQERSADLQRRRNQRLWNNAYQHGNRLPEDQLGDMGSLVHPAAMKYQPQPYGGRVMFFQSSDWPKGGYWKFQRGWPGLIRGPMEVHTIDAEHEEMLHDPNVDGISGPILSYLAEAGDANYAPVNSDAALAGRS
ncbi:MAG: amino acid adenylation domain-containing protein [Candidatus Sulfotelmatobacter sp.]